MASAGDAMQSGAQSKALEIMNSRNMALFTASLDDSGFRPRLDEAPYNEITAKATLIQKPTRVAIHRWQSCGCGFIHTRVARALESYVSAHVLAVERAGVR